MEKRKRSMTLNIPTAVKPLLERLALDHGCLWGEKPNISLLIERIGRGEILLGEPTPTSEAIKALATVEADLEMALTAIRQLQAPKVEQTKGLCDENRT